MTKKLTRALAACLITALFLPFAAAAGDNDAPATAVTPDQAVMPVAETQATAPLTLEECINIALGGHPKVLAAEQDRLAGLYVTRQAMSSYWPQVTVQGTRSYIKSERLIRFGSLTVNTTAKYVPNNIDIDVNWLLFDFGRRYYNVRSLSKVEDRLMHDMDAAQQTVAFDVMDAYFGVLKAESLIDVAKATKEAADQHLQRAESFYDAGSKPRFDVTQAEVEVNDAKLGLIQANDALKLANADLNTKLGRDPLAPISIEPLTAPVELDRKLSEYIDEAYVNRPEIASLKSSAESAEMSVNAAIADFLPSISASATQNWYREDDMNQFLQNQNVTIALQVPLFEGFNSLSKYEESKARVLAAGYRVDDLKRDIALEVSKAYLDVEDAKARVDTLGSSVKKAKENLDIAEGRYEAGVGAIIEVTDARVSLTQAETNLTQAEYDYHIAYTSLLKSTGKVLAERMAD